MLDRIHMGHVGHAKYGLGIELVEPNIFGMGRVTIALTILCLMELL